MSGEAAAVAAGSGLGVRDAAGSGRRRASPGRIALWVLVHCGSLLAAVACLAAYEHFRAEGSSTVALLCVAAAGVLAFAPLRHLVGVVFGIERRTMHLVHGVGGLGLLALPVTGVVSGAPVLTHAAMGPFALMGAAQAVMHQDRPRDARQAAALRSFAASLPEVARFARARSLASPDGARRAVAGLSDVLAKAQALGRTEVASDPGFQSAFRRVCTRFGAGLGMDAVQLVLGRLAANAGTAAAVPALRRQLAQARASLAPSGSQGGR